MHGIVTTVEIDAARSDEASKLLREFTIPRVTSQDGFVRGVWLRSLDGANGRGVVLFETEEQAQAAAARAQQGPPAGSPVTVRSVDVFEVVAEA